MTNDEWEQEKDRLEANIYALKVSKAQNVTLEQKIKLEKCRKELEEQLHKHRLAVFDTDENRVTVDKFSMSDHTKRLILGDNHGQE